MTQQISTEGKQKEKKKKGGGAQTCHCFGNLVWKSFFFVLFCHYRLLDMSQSASQGRRQYPGIASAVSGTLMTQQHAWKSPRCLCKKYSRKKKKKNYLVGGMGAGVSRDDADENSKDVLGIREGLVHPPNDGLVCWVACLEI